MYLAPTDDADCVSRGGYWRSRSRKQGGAEGEVLMYLAPTDDAADAEIERQNPTLRRNQSLRMYAKISGATMVASDWIMNFGVAGVSLPHVIFSFGTAPE